MRMLEAFQRAEQRGGQRRSAAWSASFVLGAVTVLCLGAAIPIYGAAQAPSALAEFQSNGGTREGSTLTIVEGSQARLKFSKPIQSGAQVSVEMADGEVAEVKVVSGDELLVRGKKVGRTNLMVWFKDGGPDSYDVVVRRDLSVLEGALRAIHPSLQVQAAADRHALVLTGTVPDGQIARRAELAARDYAAAASDGGKDSRVINLVRVQAAATSIEQSLEAQFANLGAPNVRLSRMQRGPVADDDADVFVLSGSVSTSSVLDDVADLIKAVVGKDSAKTGRLVIQVTVSDRPHAVENVIERAIREQLGHRDVTVSRVAGAGSDGRSDILVMQGTVPSQTALTQVLALASKVFRQQDLVQRKDAGEYERITETFAGGLTRTRDVPLKLENVADDVRAATDESGALYNDEGAGSLSNETGSSLRGILSTPFGGLTAGGGTAGASRLLENRVGANIARAKAVELADGRILSFIQVEDIPQVRVAIRLVEISRTDLLNWDSNINKLGVADFDTNGINPNNVSRDPNGEILTNANGDPILAASGTDVANVISFLEGGFANQIQVGGEHFNLDAVFRLLETEGVARSLASPTLTVLSGEIAAFGDGGSVSITSSVTTQVGGINSSDVGVFKSVQQLPFGIQLAVRPLVDEDGFITLDVAPSVSNPDFALTALVRQTTGTPQETLAFATKNLRTSARLRDGEVLMIGGLTDRSRKDDVGKTPGLSSIPILGWLFQDKKYEDKDRELLIVVSPTIVRDRPVQARLWAYPESMELLGRSKPVSDVRQTQAQDAAAKQ